MKIRMDVVLLAVALASPAVAEIPDDDKIEQGAFFLDFKACTRDRHVASVRLKMTNYSPVDTPPPGYTQASKDETQKAVAVTFPPKKWSP